MSDAAPVLTLKEIFQQARALTDTPEKWGKGLYEAFIDDAPKCCVMRALKIVLKTTATTEDIPYKKMMGYVEEHSESEWERSAVALWQDNPNRTHQEILDMWDALIKAES